MKRRMLLGGGLAFLAKPLAVSAQQSGKIHYVGIVSSAAAPGRLTVLWQAFLDALRELGYVQDRNLVVRQAFAAGKREDLPALVTDLVKKGVDVLVTTSNPETIAAKRATTTIPVIMTVALDPVEQGLVATLARPGGNVTGLTSLVPGLSQKYVELLKEALPSMSRAAIVTGPGGPNPQIRDELEAAARHAGIALEFAEVNDPEQIAAVLARAKKSGCRAIVAPLDGRTYLHRRKLVERALQHGLPGIYWSRDYVEDGGLMAYGASLPDLGRRAATFVDKILKGAKPGDLPIEQPSVFELVINRRTARALRMTIPNSLLLRADHVLE
jgi:putative tryptophan/tyrosine transport system substrate-binding protein